MTEKLSSSVRDRHFDCKKSINAGDQPETWMETCGRPTETCRRLTKTWMEICQRLGQRFAGHSDGDLLVTDVVHTSARGCCAYIHLWMDGHTSAWQSGCTYIRQMYIDMPDLHRSATYIRHRTYIHPKHISIVPLSIRNQHEAAFVYFFCNQNGGPLYLHPSSILPFLAESCLYQYMYLLWIQCPDSIPFNNYTNKRQGALFSFNIRSLIP